MTQAFLLMLISLLPLFPAQTQDDLKAIQKLGQQCVTATITGNFNQLIDLTYPKVIELLGGREKMVASMKKDFNEAKERGFAPLPTTVNAPAEVLKAGTQKFVVMTYQLRMKVPGGILKRDSFLIGVVDRPGDKWTFVDGTTMNEAQFKYLFPAAVSKLRLPSRPEPVFEKTP